MIWFAASLSNSAPLTGVWFTQQFDTQVHIRIVHAIISESGFFTSKYLRAFRAIIK